MIKVNEYFNGNVKSLSLDRSQGRATVGVILPGEYEFGTATQEIMHITAGSLKALLPGKQDWKTFQAGDKFVVEAGLKFKVCASEPMAYLCEYK